MARRVARRIQAMAARGTPLRAVMLDRLGPVVCQLCPAEASAVLEELEKSARLWLRCKPTPAALADLQIDALRSQFGAAW